MAYHTHYGHVECKQAHFEKALHLLLLTIG